MTETSARADRHCATERQLPSFLPTQPASPLTAQCLPFGRIQWRRHAWPVAMLLLFLLPLINATLLWFEDRYLLAHFESSSGTAISARSASHPMIAPLRSGCEETEASYQEGNLLRIIAQGCSNIFQKGEPTSERKLVPEAAASSRFDLRGIRAGSSR